MLTNATKVNKRFEVLDSFRGLCATLIVLGHFATFVNVKGFFGPIIINSYVFVDFFFVLSGFVVSHAYLNKIVNLNTFKNFIFVRFFRVYPLHLFMLFLFVILEVVKSSTQHIELFINPLKSLDSLIANIFLTQSLGIYKYLTWNFPSWSISTEFYTYITFVIVVLFLKNQVVKIAVLISIFVPLLLIFSTGKTIFDFTADYGFFRCLNGFFIGVISFKIYQYLNKKIIIGSFLVISILEILMVALITLFAINANVNYITYASPILFSMAVVLFTYQSGVVSELLKRRFFLILGTLSYSIYMTHTFIQVIIFQIASKFSDKYNLGLTIYKQKENSYETIRYYLLTESSLILLTLLMLSLVFMFSYLTYMYIEKPTYSWGRKLCK